MFAIDPPIVPLFLTAGSPIPSAKSASDGIDFLTSFETALKKGELIEAIEFQVPQKSSYQKCPNPASRYAIVGVYVAKFKKESNVAITGAESVVFRCKKIEDALNSNFSSSAIEKVQINSSSFNSDIHASAEYRANLIKVFAKKAVEAC